MDNQGRWRLDGKTALVTGGTKGIGYAVVEELGGLGASVYTCSRNEAQLKECLRVWDSKGFRVSGSVCDMSSQSGRNDLVAAVSSLFHAKLDILINNVGTNKAKPTVDYTATDFSHLMETNLESAYNMCQLCHPLLKASGSASMVFISSVNGLLSINNGSIYSMAKAAMNQLTKVLACEWAKDNIRSNCVAPWFTRTPLAEPFLSNEAVLKNIVSRTPMGRVAEANEVSPLVAFLCLPSASYISGQVIAVDGAFSVNGLLAFPSHSSSSS